MDMKRLQDIMKHDWVPYMNSPSHKLGYPQKSLCISNGGGASDDTFDHMCEAADLDIAMAIDSLIDGLHPPHRTAINHSWLKVPHYYPTQDMDYEDGMDSLLEKANKRNLI